MPHIEGPSKSWTKNPKAPAATRDFIDHLLHDVDRVGANVEVRGNRISRCHHFLLFKATQLLSGVRLEPIAHDIALSRSMAEKRKVLSSIADHPALPIEVAHAARIHPAACSIKGPFALIAFEHILTPTYSA